MAEPKPKPSPRVRREVEGPSLRALKVGGFCPICGEPINWINTRKRELANGEIQVYYYVAHVIGKGETGRRKIRYCYVGAKHYKYVEMFNPLGLRHLLDPERYVDYAIYAVEEIIEGLEGEDRKTWLKLAEKVHTKLSESLKELEKAIQEAKQEIEKAEG